MRRRRKQASVGQEAVLRIGRDAPAGKVSRGEAHRRSTKHKKRSYVTLPFGVRVVRRSWYLGLLTAASVSVLLGILLAYAVRQYASDATESVDLSMGGAIRGELISSDVSEAGVVELDAAVTPEGEGPPLSIESILEKYRNVSGLSGVEGVVLNGHYMEDGRDFDMKLLAKLPGLVRKNLTDDALKMVCRYDGEVAKIEIEDPEGAMHSQPLTDVLYQQAIILEGAVLSLVSDKLPDVLVYKWEADQEYEGQTCWTIRRRMSTNQSMIHLLDPETGLERVRFVYFMHEGQRHQLSIHLSDYRQQGAGKLPFAYTMKLNGEARGEARLDSIRLNPGLMPWMFESGGDP